MCCQDGRAAIRRARPSCVKRAAEAGGSFFRQGQSASDELPTSFAELTIVVVAIQTGEAIKGTVPPGQPEAAA
jgi:hypothetical protein